MENDHDAFLASNRSKAQLSKRRTPRFRSQPRSLDEVDYEPVGDACARLALHLGGNPEGQAMKVEFIDSGREPKSAPNPDYPNGMDVDMSQGMPDACTAEIPYPAPRCGVMVIECGKCGLRVGVTVAGRPDDPRTVKMACKHSVQ